MHTYNCKSHFSRSYKLKLSAGYFYQAVMRQVNSKLQILPPPSLGKSCVQMPHPRSRFDGQMPLSQGSNIKKWELKRDIVHLIL